MEIKLTTDEFMNIVNAVNIAKHFYEERNMLEFAKQYEALNELFLVAPSISVEVSKGLTESGRQALKEILARRKQAERDAAKVIQFPFGE
ncbi:hypothetical protein JCM14036_30480 [Desulfotomaculum defluvii]